MDTSSPARLYCTLVGAVLVIAGIIGFFWSSSFETGSAAVARESDEVLGLLAVNGWHNVIGHLAIGLLLLAAAGSAPRQAALGVGLVYIVLTVWGFLVVEDGFGDILGLIPINTEDNVLHLILGLTGLAAGAATPAVDRERRVSTA
jgi:hypothetical protein